MRRGFTLVELLVVIAIIGLIASIVLVNLQGTRQRGRVAAGKQFSSQLQNTLGDQAVGIWRFNEGSGTTAYDNAGYGNNGTLTGGPSWKTEDECGLGLGACLEFDGTDDYVTVLDSSILSFSDNIFTIAFWIKADTTGSAMHVFNKNGTAGSNWEYGAESSGTGFQFVARNLGGSNVYAQATEAFSAEWTHYVWTADGTEGKVYKNGALISTTTKTANDMGNGAGNLEIGRGRSGTSFNGHIDDFHIFASALTTAQVRELYAAGAPRYGLTFQ